MYTASDRNLTDVRFPVQYVIRPQNGRGDIRALAGQIVGGVLKPGDDVVVLPSGMPTKILSIDTADGEVLEAYPPMSVTLRLEDELDVSRGDMISRQNNRPNTTQDLDAMECWMDETALHVGQKYAIKHTTRTVRALVKEIQYELDMNTQHRTQGVNSLGLNAIGRVRLRTTQPLLVDPYRRNRNTGAFIIIDEVTNRTVGAGVITDN